MSNPLDPKPSDPDVEETSGRIAFDYIKGADFRVIRADGAIGSVTPNGHIHMALYSERPALPRRMVYELKATGDLGEPIESETITRGTVVREMTADVFLTLATAKNLRRWLDDRIDELEQAFNLQKTASGDEE